MLFNSVNFVFFFPIVVLFHWVLPSKIRKFWLLFCSIYFYACWNVDYTSLLLFSTFVTYVSARLLENATWPNSTFTPGKEALKERLKEEPKLVLKRKFYLFTCLGLNLAVLFLFKYCNFFFDTVRSFGALFNVSFHVNSLDLLLPMGISFYTFQALGYILDVYYGQTKASHNFWEYLLFISFFPQLVAGPIERYTNLMPQLLKDRSFDTGKVKEGIFFMLLGYFQKMVIADRCALIVDMAFIDSPNMQGSQMLVASLAFALQIYGDFSGYSLIAIGGAKILGIDLMYNFRQPYFAMSPNDFWKRWHISLSTWFKDYCYIPLGGNRCSVSRKYFNLAVTFLVSGLWHGANWTFVVWGAVHGFLVIMQNVVSVFFKEFFSKDKWKKLADTCYYKILAKGAMFAAAVSAWIFFRSQSLNQAFSVFKSIFTDFNLSILFTSQVHPGITDYNFTYLIIALTILFIIDFLSEKFGNFALFINNCHFTVKLFIAVILLYMILNSTSIQSREFIYFQF